MGYDLIWGKIPVRPRTRVTFTSLTGTFEESMDYGGEGLGLESLGMMFGGSLFLYWLKVHVGTFKRVCGNPM